MSTPHEMNERESTRPPRSEAPTELDIGSDVDGYEIARAIGLGGMGAVYEAVRQGTSDGRRFALKVLRKRHADDDVAIARFRREARALADLNHVGIVEIISTGKLSDGRPYLVMPLMQGETLREHLDGRADQPAMDVQEAWRITRALATALAAAHAAGIIHRDVKPDNIFLERAEEGGTPFVPRLLDFGLAKLDPHHPERLASPDREPDSVRPLQILTNTGAPVGTPAYMAPEQWWGQPAEAATDQYALGIVLFELLVGHRPCTAHRYADLLQWHIHEPPPTMAEAGRADAAALDAVVARMLKKRPTERFADMMALIAAGDEALGYTPPIDAVAQTGNLRHQSDDGPASVPQPSDNRPPQSIDDAGRRTFGLVVLAMILVGVGAAAMGYASPIRHNVVEIVGSAGFSPYVTLVFFIGGVVQAFRASNASSRRRNELWAVALGTALSGALGTYSGWFVVKSNVGDLPHVDRYVYYNLGLFEANAGRFVSLLACVPLLLAIAITAGSRRAESKTRASAGWSLVPIGLGALLLSLPGLLLGAGQQPAGLVLLVTGVALGTAYRRDPQDSKGRLDRLAAILLSILAAFAAGLTRIDSDEASAWSRDLSRPQRATLLAEGTNARYAIYVALAAGLVWFGVWLFRAMRAEQLRPSDLVPKSKSSLLVLFAFVVASVDVALSWDFQRLRSSLRNRIDAQFAVFRELSPPMSTLPAQAFPVSDVVTLQLTRQFLALNGEGLSPAAALDSKGADSVLQGELMRAVGSAASQRLRPGEPVPNAAMSPAEVALTVDAEQPCARVQRLLQLLAAGGVSNVELRLLRPTNGELSPDAPPEAHLLLPSDFVGLQLSLTRDPTLPALARESYGQCVTEIEALARSGQRIPIYVPLGR